MNANPSWAAPRPFRELAPSELAGVGTVFEHDGFVYRSTGRRLGFGGMGNVFLIERKADDAVELCVIKTFHANYLHQLKTDEITRRDYEAVVRNMQLIRDLKHPHILPTYAAEPLGDNYITVTPLMDATMRQAIAVQAIPPRRRVELLIQALHGLGHMHRSGLVHRDFTLRNILVQDNQAYLFDFDLTLSLADVVGETYRSYYRGRIFGSPGYSVPPEILETALMEQPVTAQLDIYGAGSALFALFTDQLPSGEAEDMWGLLLKIAEGLVDGGRSKIVYPPEVPRILRPIIERCMERHAKNRYDNVDRVIMDLEQVLPHLNSDEGPQTARVTWTGTGVNHMESAQRGGGIAGDPAFIRKLESSLHHEGYILIRSLGEVSGNPIYVATPDPVLVAEGRFPDTNIYPKIITVKTLADGKAGSEQLVDLWFGRYLPLLQRARQGLLTPLHRVCWDADHKILTLMSEYVEDARFGTHLDGEHLTREEALALALLVGRQVRRIHEVGLAHNNVRAESLLFKAVPAKGRVFPAMVGLVEPSEDPDHMAEDVRNLADLTLSWLHGPYRDDDDDTLLSAESQALTAPLRKLAMQSKERPAIEDFDRCICDGLASVDRNFALIRRHQGDIEEYALLLISYPLYNRLWGT